MSNKSIQQFIARKQRYQKMKQFKMIPQNTKNRFIIPCLHKCFGFKTNQYAQNSEKLQDYIDKSSFENFVKKSNSIIDQQMMIKSQNEDSSFFCITGLLLKLSIALCILTFTILACIIYIDFEAHLQSTILTVIIVLINISVGVASISPIYLYLRKYKDYDYESRIMEQLEKLAEQQNKLNTQKGKEYLKWKFEKSFFWIELLINQNFILERSRKFVYRFEDHNDTPTLMQ